MIEELRELWKDGHDAKSVRMQEMIYNLRMAAGQQNSYFKKSRKDWIEPNWTKMRRTPIIIINLLANLILASVNRLTYTKPEMHVLPATNGTDDINAAAAAERFLDYINDMIDGDELDISAASLLTQTGRAYDYSFIVEKKEGEILADVDIMAEILSAFEITPPPGVASDKDWAWVMIDKLRSERYVVKKYNIPEDEIKNLHEEDDQVDYNLDALLYQSRPEGTKKDDMVLLHEFYELPNPDFPRGRYIVWCGYKILKEMDWPHDFLPVTAFGFIPTDGTHWWRCPVDNANQLQKTFNVLLSMGISGMKKVCMPKILNPIECGIPDTDLSTNQGGEILNYSATAGMGHKPEYMVAGIAVSQDLYRQLEFLLELLKDCFGLHGATMGESPPARTPIGLHEAVIEQDTSKLNPVATLWVTTKKRISQKRLQLAQKYLPQAKKFSLLGRNGHWEVYHFDAAKLQPGWDIRVVPGSGQYRSKAAQKQIQLELAQQGIFPKNPATGEPTTEWWEALEMGNFASLNEQLSGAIRQARAENEIMRTGQWPDGRPLEIGPDGVPTGPITYPTYDHISHGSEHQRLINSEEFLFFPPPQQQMIINHHVSHFPAPSEPQINSMIPQSGQPEQGPPPQGVPNA